ncbi:hypothetical protein MVEN_01924400 [Mycena venus]|uniref:Histone deacetylase complex subunit SAP18 n=1 Tax=Mycena venus TaxID=2733690 RepID=A0A8H7CLT3_9AGAR|nr:hypothetical protein MVEN_01924400 [Mycena venus]
MDVDSTPAEDTSFSREKTAPFLIRTFLKIGSFHRITLFEDGTLPTTDEQQLFTWKDATLREILTTLRNTAPHVAEYRHPLARFSFRTVYVEQGSRGRFVSKDLGMVYSRDILGEPGTLTSTAPRLLEDTFEESGPIGDERTLDDLRFVPGDFLLVAVLLPKSVTLPTEISIKGAAPAANGWRSGPGLGSAKGDGGWGGAGAALAPQGGGLGAGRGVVDTGGEIRALLHAVVVVGDAVEVTGIGTEIVTLTGLTGVSHRRGGPEIHHLIEVGGEIGVVDGGGIGIHARVLLPQDGGAIRYIVLFDFRCKLLMPPLQVLLYTKNINL